MPYFSQLEACSTGSLDEDSSFLIEGCQIDDRSAQTRKGQHPTTKCCQALGCPVRLSKGSPAYCFKRGLCPAHIKAESLHVKGGGKQLWRFCQQCGKLETLDRFEGNKRSCRIGLRKRRVIKTTTQHDNLSCIPSLAASSSTTLRNSPQPHQQQNQQRSTGADHASVPETIKSLEGQLHTLQSLLVQLEAETAAAAAEFTELCRAGSSSSSDGFMACAMFNAQALERGAYAADFAAACPAAAAAVAGPSCRNNNNSGYWQRQATPSSSGTVTVAPSEFAPTTVEQWMQLADADDAYFSAWVEHQLQQDDSSAASAAALLQLKNNYGHHRTQLQRATVSQTQARGAPNCNMPAQNLAVAVTAEQAAVDMEMLIEQELWSLCCRF